VKLSWSAVMSGTTPTTRRTTTAGARNGSHGLIRERRRRGASALGASTPSADPAEEELVMRAIDR
jgi:hypothetical protein